MSDNDDNRNEILEYIERFGVAQKDQSEKHSRAKKQTVSRRKRGSRVTLDLHGQRAEEAERTLRAAIHRCRETGTGELLVIHGYGRHSNPAEGPVLKNMVLALLDNDLHPLFRYYRAAPFKDGGDGATIIRFH